MLSQARRICVGALLLLPLLVSTAWTQDNVSEKQNRDWDISVWVAGATGEEHLNSFSEAQILSGGLFVGRTLTGQMGRGWRRGNLEFGMSLIPLFVHFTPQRLYGGGFEPVVLRWNSSFRVRRIAPYIELAGGGVRTNGNLPAGNTSDFNFTARGGGGIRISTRPRQAVDVGFRWWHISNANLGLQNPEFNGIQLSVGYHWFK